MFTSFVVRLVNVCRKQAVLVVVLGLLMMLGLTPYVVDHIKMNTDMNQLLSDNLDWRKQEQALEKAFPQSVDRLAIVIDGDTPDTAEEAAETLASALKNHPDVFKTVERPDAIPFFKKNGMLYLEPEEVGGLMEGLVQGQPVLGSIAADPSLRGLFSTLSMIVMGMQQGAFDVSKAEQPLMKLSDSIEAVLAGQDKPFPWRSLMAGDQKPSLRDVRKIILVQPVLDYSALTPGKAASDLVRSLAKDAGLTQNHGVRIRLTGSVALNDEEFASVAEGTTMATIVSVVLVLFILFLALRSVRLILPILLTLVAGLVATTSFALVTIGSLNLISVAFAVMFVGIAVDFGIQFGVRYRGVRHTIDNHAEAMTVTAKEIAVPLALAASATAIGFLAFTPTDYKGVAELGLIAGAGMIIAFVLNITLLPALLTLFKPHAEQEKVGFAWAAPLDSFLEKEEKRFLLALVLALVGCVIAYELPFDFDPLNLKDPKTESMATLYDLMVDPEATPYTIEMLEPSQAEAEKRAAEIEKLPEVDHVMTLASFVPEKQKEILPLIEDANLLLAPTLNPAEVKPAPSEEEIVEAITQTTEMLKLLPPEQKAAARLAQVLEGVLERKDAVLLQRLHNVFIGSLVPQLDTVRSILSAQTVTVDSITDDLKKDWITQDGKARVVVYPKGDARNPDTLISFTDAVRKIAPESSGSPISIRESGKTITGAFIHAGIAGLVAIAILLFFVLKKPREVAILLASLLMAGILTLATLTLIGMPLNYANIIALPLLLSLGVSYAIYFVAYWKQGQKRPLSSSMARAVLFSAATTSVAFGSLSLSTHPGTRSMGELLTIAMIYCVICSFLLLPALLGETKVDKKEI